VLIDADGRTMIIESPCCDCSQNSIVHDQIATVRQTVEAEFPTPATGGVGHTSVPVTVTRVAFFDRLHGQDRVAPNGIELDPVLSFVVGGAPATPQPLRAGTATARPAESTPASPV
jgi:hypothetical protein